MDRLRVGVIGFGFIGAAHVDALRRVPGVTVTALAGSSLERARAQAAAADIPNAYGDWRELLADEQVDVVHNCTPNYLHFDINRATIEAGKACFAEKPLTVTTAQSAELVSLAQARGVPVAVNFNHRGFPQVQEARALIAAGQLGEIHAVRGSYLQDWLLFDSDWSWRLDAVAGGPSRAMADIGSHWMDLAQHVGGTRIVEVVADLATVVPVHYRPKGAMRTFGARDVENRPRRSSDGMAIEVRTEDQGSVLLRFDTRARGAFSVSQVTAGRKNRLTLEIDGGRGALAWDSEDAEHLWLGSRQEPSRLAQRDPTTARVAGTSTLPAGHAEGWSDALRNVVAGFYAMLRGAPRPPWVASWEDGLQAVALTEAILASSKEQHWVALSTDGVGSALNSAEGTRNQVRGGP
jgi:predicted dehydrogenase